MADYKTPQWLLPNEKNLAYPAAGDGITGSGLSEDRHSLYSMDFDGTQYIDCGTSSELKPKLVSCSVWIKGSSSSNPQYTRIVSQDGPTAGADAYGFYVTSTNKVVFAIKTSVTGTVTSSLSSVVLDDNWHNIVGTYDGSNVNIYVDGSVVGSPVSGTGDLTYGSGGFTIGCMSEPTALPSQEFTGQIDEVAIWNKALSATEVAALSTASAPANVMALSAKPIAYYPLGEQAQMGSANWSFPNGSLQSHVVDFSTQDYIQYPHININGAFTVSTWVKTTDTNTYGNLFSSSDQFGGDPSGGSSIANNWKLVRWNRSARFNASNSSNSIIFDVNTGTSGTRPNLYDGNWHHVLAIWDGTTNSNGVKIFFDGVLRGLGTASSTAINNDNSIPIRAGSSNATFDFIGEQSNQQIWNTALTYGSASADGDIAGGDVANVYNNGSPQSTYTVTPTAWWKLNAANSSYVYPWSLELNGRPDVSGSGDHAKVVSNALQVQDIATTTNSGKVDFLTREITGAYSGIDVTGEFIVYAASAGQSGATLYYKIDGGSWVQFQQELRTDNTATTYAISGASGLTSTTSFQVKIEFETGNAGSASVTLNNISIGGLYTEDFTNQDGAGWDNDTYTPPPVDWTFIDTETPAPNYTSALDFPGVNQRVGLASAADLGINSTISVWLNTDNQFFSSVNDVVLGYDAEYPLYINNNLIYVNIAGVLKSFTPNSKVVGRWYNITIVRTGDSVEVFQDGQSLGTQTGYGTAVNTYLNYIGSRQSGGFAWDGKLSNVSVFNSSLSSAQVETIYNNGTPEVSISHSPTGWWKLDNTTTGIQDSVGSNNGTITGSVTQIATNVLISNNGESDTLPTSALIPSDLQFESPYSNYSLSFDGIANYVDCGNDSSLQFSGSFTISTWARVNDSGNNAIISKNSSSSSGNGYHIDFRSGNSVHAWAYNANNKVIVTGLSTGVWYNIIFVFESTGGSNGNQSLYVNAATPSTNTITNFSVSTIKNLRIGDSEAISGLEMNGNIDEVAIWNTALTQAQVIQVYNNGYPNDLTSLSPSQWWRLGEDAYFVGNDITIPNQITGGSTGTGAGTQTAILVGDAPGSYANGSGTNLAVEDRIGDAPESTANSVSINMIPSNRISYPAGYVPTQVDNAFSMAFDGVSNSKFNVNPPTIGSDNTISAWAKRVGTGNMFLLGNTSSGGYGCYFVGTSGVYVQGSGGYFAFTNSAVTTAMVRTDWVNWVFIKNSSAGTVSVYVDGELAQSASSTGGMDSLTSIGGSGLPTGSQFPWNGNIDEVAVFNYILSERQIKQDIYEGTTTGKTADLNNISNLTAPVAWYRMGD